MQRLCFHKLHALANDFVLVDFKENRGMKLTRALIRAVADRKRGVGFDQLLVLLPARTKGAARRLVIYNMDGSRAEMCGNGLRAAAYYLWRARASGSRREIFFETDVGLRMARYLSGGMIECGMGVPKILPARLLRSRVFSSRVCCIDVGNPHAVVFAHPPSKKKFAESGAAIENHRAFPRRTNVEFVRVSGRSALDVLVWERGVGETEACGTGAVAAAVAAITKGLVRAGVPVRVKFPGGVAVVSWNGPGSEAFLRGSATLVYSGKILQRRAL